MRLKSHIKILLERITKRRIYGYLPRGVDPVFDIHQSFEGWCPGIIIDVGACTGQRALEFAAKYPKAIIYCFEPEANNFQKLNNNLKRVKNIHCFQKAVSDKCRDGVLILGDRQDTHKLQDSASNTDGINNFDKEIDSATHHSKELSNELLKDIQQQTVEICTLDGFADQMHFKNVQYLKVDTEGNDLNVLVGAGNLILNQNIDFIEVETGMNPDNTLHISFEKMKQYLEGHQYLIFGIYEQTHEWPSNHPNLRRVNSIYVSKKMLDRNRQS